MLDVRAAEKNEVGDFPIHDSEVDPKQMDFDLETFDLAVEKNIRPCLIGDNQLNDGESYQHTKVIPTVQALLSRASLEKSCFENLKKALTSSVNLLNRNEAMQAGNFIELVPEDELHEWVTQLLYADEDLEVRLTRFLEWAAERKTAKGHPAKINLTVATFLLAMTDPTRYAFCKPSVYAKAANALLHKQGEGNTPARATATNTFYKEALTLFQNRYGLPFSDLQHVHIAFYLMQNPYSGYPNWSELAAMKSSNPGTATHHALNTILYGPPGTGKTYDTVRRAVEICDGALALGRPELVRRFDELRKENRIQFVTFHQAYAYEDFIEGLRPVLHDDEASTDESGSGDVRYECRPGIFKQLCELARLDPSGSLRSQVNVDFQKSKIWKMSLGDTQSSEPSAIFDECIDRNLIRLGYGGDMDFSDCQSRGDILAKLRTEYPETSKADFTITAVHALKNSMQEGDLVVVSEGNLKFRAVARVTGGYRFLDEEIFRQARPVEWLVTLDESLPRETIYNKNFSQMTIYGLDKSEIKIEALKQLLRPSSAEKRNYVIVIDEINRGNIAKILGELITLLEPDKRLGSANELRATLPYSGKPFGIPGNVYVIGTMNTADRSIAFLDVALRRRFKFEEMMPDYELVSSHWSECDDSDQIDLAGILEVINARIELLYDRDHQIGHSFFLGVKSIAEVRDVFCHRVIPLLQEYFYGDWPKVCTVLGCPVNPDSISLQNNTHPIVKADSLSKRAKLENDDDIEDKPVFMINPDFLATTQAKDLVPFFDHI